MKEPERILDGEAPSALRDALNASRAQPSPARLSRIAARLPTGPAGPTSMAGPLAAGALAVGVAVVLVLRASTPSAPSAARSDGPAAEAEARTSSSPSMEASPIAAESEVSAPPADPTASDPTASDALPPSGAIERLLDEVERSEAGHRGRRAAAPVVEPEVTSETVPEVTSETAPEVAVTAPLAPEVHPSVPEPALDEAEALLRIRRLLTTAPRAALEELDALEARLPESPLQMEREVLRIQALAAVGDPAEARRLGERFLAAHPGSMFEASVRRAIEP